MAEADAAAIEIVGRHLDDDAIADTGADAELSHLAGGIRQHLVIVVEFHPEIAVRENLGNRTVKFQQFLFRHPIVSSCLNSVSRPCGVARPGAA